MKKDFSWFFKFDDFFIPFWKRKDDKKITENKIKNKKEKRLIKKQKNRNKWGGLYLIARGEIL